MTTKTYSTSEFSENIDALFDNRIEKPGCAVGVIENGQYIHKRGYGYANLEHMIPIDSKTIFRIGSVSKQFTSMAIAILEEKGLLSFEDEMQTHIPDLINYGEKVTINHMIHHYSGLGDYEYIDYPGRFKNAVGEEFRWGNEDYLSNQEFHDLVKTLPLIRKPESKFWYSNNGYVLLALVVENISKKQLVSIEEFEHTLFRTPELYFGYKFAQNRNQLGSDEGFQPEKIVKYNEPNSIELNKFYPIGNWKNHKDSMELMESTGSIKLSFNAKEVNIVTENNAQLEIFLDGVALTKKYAGSDISFGNKIDVSNAGMYNIISSQNSISHTMEILIEGKGFQAFTFTFG